VLSFDVDAESAYVFHEPHKAAAQLAGVEERRFGPRVGVPRILRLLDEFGLKGSFYVPGYTVVHHTETVRAIAAAGHELGCHGNMHEPVDTLDEAQETTILIEQLQLFDAYLGVRPLGYRGPAWELNVFSPALLKRHGFLYDSSLMGDDVPYELSTPDGPLVEVPVQWLLDDVPYFAFVPGTTFAAIGSTDAAIAEWRREFEGMYDEGGCFTLTMHPWLSGRSGRLRGLRELIAHMRTFEGVWFATGLEVAT